MARPEARAVALLLVLVTIAAPVALMQGGVAASSDAPGRRVLGYYVTYDPTSWASLDPAPQGDGRLGAGIAIQSLTGASRHGARRAAGGDAAVRVDTRWGSNGGGRGRRDARPVGRLDRRHE